MLRYTGLLVDLDDTLIKTRNAKIASFKRTADIIAKRLDLDENLLYETFLKERKILRKKLEGTIAAYNRLITFRSALDTLRVNYTLDQIVDIKDILWEDFFTNVTPFEGVKKTLEQLRQKGVKVVIISDGELDIRLKKLDRTELFPYIDDLVTSEEIGCGKPNKKLFITALTKIEKKPEEVIMLGNHLISDIYGAQRLKIRAGLFDPDIDGNVVQDNSGKISPDFVIKKFPELLKEFGL